MELHDAHVLTWFQYDKCSYRSLHRWKTACYYCVFQPICTFKAR